MKKKFVVISGGTGGFTVLRGLKRFDNLDLTAIVTMTDSGGSTGRLRDEFGMLPVGDARMCLVALSKEDEAADILRELFLYRFPNSSPSLAGHNFGNLFLTALTELLGSEIAAIEAAEKILAISGKVLPVTTDKVNIFAKYDDGSSLTGEALIDEPPVGHNKNAKLIELSTKPKAHIYKDSRDAILAADYVLIGPGDLYSSLISNLVIDGVKDALQQSKAKLIYVTNLVSKYGQTTNMKNSDYVKEITRYAGRKPDYIIVNNGKLPTGALNKYKAENSFPIEDDLTDEAVIVRADILAKEEIKRRNNDVVQRSLIRHDSNNLAAEIMRILR